MKKIFTILFLFIGLLLNASDKYIATAANGGSNSNNGSIDSPWLTLAYACANTTSGDVIHVGVGTFTETARCSLSVGVSIVGQGITSEIISNFKASSSISALIYLSSTGVVNGNQSISNIKLTGDYPNGSYGDRGIYTKGRTNVEIHHCTIENFLSSGVKFDGYSVAYNSKTGPTTYLTANSFHDNILTNCAFFGGTEANLFIIAQEGFTCYNNTITQNTRTAGTDGELVKTDNVRGLLFHDNICNSPTDMAGQWNFIGEWWSCRGGVEVYNNTFNGAANFDIAGVITEKTIYDFGVKIYSNQFLNPSIKAFSSNGRRVLAICIENWNSMTDIYIYNNYIKNYGDGIEIAVAGQSGYGPSTCDNIHIYYNVIENCGYNTQGYNWGIGILYQYASVHHNNINICNNVIIGGTAYSYSGLRYDTDHENTNIRIQNNIIKGFSSNAIKFYNNNAGTLDYLWITNNILNANGSNTISFDGMTPTHFTYDSPITNDPLFVGGSPYNFHLRSGSPAINAGVPITTPTIATDYGGITIGNPPEIGVYEYGISVPTVSFTATMQSKAESDGTATVTAQLSEAVGETVTVPFTITGTATNLSDYTVTPNPITIIAGATTGTATVTIVNDTANEEDETVLFTMGTPTIVSQGSTTIHTLTITDDDHNTIYYIDPSGSDATGNGTSDNPWKSLYKACATVKTPGDIIHVNAGTYLETAQSALAVGVSIEGEGVTSIIKSHVSAASTPTIVLSSGTQGTDGNQSISNIKMDGDALTAYSAIKVTSRSNVSIHDCTFIDFNNNGVLFNGASAGGLPTVWAKGNKFYNNILTNCSKYLVGIEGRWALGMNGQERLLIYNNTMTQTSRPAGNNGYLIKAVEGYNKGVKIYNNTLTRAPAVPGSFDFAIELWNCLGGIEIYNNTLKGSIDFGGRSTVKGEYPFAVHIHHNTIGEAVPNINTQSVRGILLESTIEDVLIEKNYINNVAAGIYFAQDLQQVKYVKNLNIQYNIFNNIGSGALEYTGWGVWWGQSVFPHIIDNVNISNNVFIGNMSNATNMWGIGLPRIGMATNIKIRNNIVQGFYYGPTYGSGGTGISIDYLSIENNIFYNNGNNNLPRYSGITPTHNTTQNNYTVNPLFVSASDFNLQPGSPAINAGLDVGLTNDYIGNSLIGLPDIGAYEFMSGDNHSPSIRDQGFQIDEGSPDGTAVGRVIATDADAGQTITYSLVSGNTNGAFVINATTGELSVANSAALNIDFALIVKAQDNGLGELSSQATVAVHIVKTAIELIGNSSTIKVYPNPVTDKLTIEFIGNMNRISFIILNSTGQIVYKGNLIEKAVVHTSGFSSGVYLMKIDDGRTFEFKKIIKV